VPINIDKQGDTSRRKKEKRLTKWIDERKGGRYVLGADRNPQDMKGKTMRDTFTLTQDPGHGWLIVTAQELHAVGLTEAAISRYSYQRGPQIALEEDCDAGAFIKAYEAKFGFVPLIETDDNGGRVRGWASFGTKVSSWHKVA
jgi:hypothetical protein